MEKSQDYDHSCPDSAKGPGSILKDALLGSASGLIFFLFMIIVFSQYEFLFPWLPFEPYRHKFNVLMWNFAYKSQIYEYIVFAIFAMAAMRKKWQTELHDISAEELLLTPEGANLILGVWRSAHAFVLSSFLAYAVLRFSLAIPYGLEARTLMFLGCTTDSAPELNYMPSTLFHTANVYLIIRLIMMPAEFFMKPGRIYALGCMGCAIGYPIFIRSVEVILPKVPYAAIHFPSVILLFLCYRKLKKVLAERAGYAPVLAPVRSEARSRDRADPDD
ncbi:hypothetical protein HYR69_07555 [Candidatus Sumerlaeota bacterium]|nr:hypothetical protein [Candidatus Sumerlaeota bacterium]